MQQSAKSLLAGARRLGVALVDDLAGGLREGEVPWDNTEPPPVPSGSGEGAEPLPRHRHRRRRKKRLDGEEAEAEAPAAEAEATEPRLELDPSWSSASDLEELSPPPPSGDMSLAERLGEKRPAVDDVGRQVYREQYAAAKVELQALREELARAKRLTKE